MNLEKKELGNSVGDSPGDYLGDPLGHPPGDPPGEPAGDALWDPLPLGDSPGILRGILHGILRGSLQGILCGGFTMDWGKPPRWSSWGVSPGSQVIRSGNPSGRPCYIRCHHRGGTPKIGGPCGGGDWGDTRGMNGGYQEDAQEIPRISRGDTGSRRDRKKVREIYQEVLGGPGCHLRIDECMLPSPAARPPSMHSIILRWHPGIPPASPRIPRVSSGIPPVSHLYPPGIPGSPSVSPGYPLWYPPEYPRIKQADFWSFGGTCKVAWS